jgi:hypothetical protein
MDKELLDICNKLLQHNGWTPETSPFDMSADAPPIAIQATQQIQALITKEKNKARIDELKKIELAQQDEDKWSLFCMDDTSDFGNYISQRIDSIKRRIQG